MHLIMTKIWYLVLASTLVYAPIWYHNSLTQKKWLYHGCHWQLLIAGSLSPATVQQMSLSKTLYLLTCYLLCDIISLKYKMQMKPSAQICCPQVCSQPFSELKWAELDTWAQRCLRSPKPSGAGRDNAYESILLSGEISLLWVSLSAGVAWSLENSMGLSLPYKATAPGMAPRHHRVFIAESRG